MGAAPLPRSTGQVRGDRFDQATVGVGGDQQYPDRPRATRSAKNVCQAGPVSEVATLIPRTSRWPSTLIPVATNTTALTTRPFSRTFMVNASAATKVNGPVAGRAQEA